MGGALHFRPVKKDDEGMYICRAFNDVGHVDSQGKLEVIGMNNKLRSFMLGKSMHSQNAFIVLIILITRKHCGHFDFNLYRASSIPIFPIFSYFLGKFLFFLFFPIFQRKFLFFPIFFEYL